MLVKKVAFGLLSVALAGLIIYGCGRVVDDNPPQPVPQTYGIVMGTVKDTAGTGVGAVTVTVAGSSSATNAQGWFSITASASTGAIVAFAKTGYIPTAKSVNIVSGQSTFIDMTMPQASTAQNINAATGGVVTSAATASGLKASLTLPAGGLVDASGAAFSGTASVILNTFDPTSTTDATAFPGNFEGVDSNGQTVPFKSFGFVYHSVTGSGDLSLATGQTATISIPVAASLTAEAAALGTCPFWHYDEADGRWEQDGVATYDAATNSFVKTVTHLSEPPQPWWNVDLPITNTSAFIKGKVVDSSGNPVPNATVWTTGANWRFSSFSGSDGSFQSRAVANETFTYYAEKSGKRTASVAIPSALSVNQEYDVGNIVLDPSIVQIAITWDQNPVDIDSHLTVPVTSTTSLGASRGHLWYSYTVDKGFGYLAAQYPYATLDTDDTSSYGPEITSIYKLYPGTYRYCIHHYTGPGTISDSKAEVNLILSGGGQTGIRKFTAPTTGGLAVNDVWRVCDIVVDSSGNITAINELGDFLRGVSASSGESFSPNGETTYHGPAQGLAVRAAKIKK